MAWEVPWSSPPKPKRKGSRGRPRPKQQAPRPSRPKPAWVSNAGPIRMGLAGASEPPLQCEASRLGAARPAQDDTTTDQARYRLTEREQVGGEQGHPTTTAI